ncbi:HD domain-containing phosphohydrolase [Rhodoferax sp. GW822-FHT02A01]|uniref:HD-GYP domain-containing protein n=1 Tax=Rhodoferax sp. GW822-FHT02A01 TaxID=3141537 RepID=UPI00315CCB3C
MKLLRLPAAKVKLGVPLPWNVRDADERLLLSKGQVVDSQVQLDALLERGAFVDFEEAKAAESLLVSQSAISSPKRPVNLFSIWDDLPNEMRLLVEALREPIDAVERIQGFVRSLVDLVDKDVDIALYHAVRQENADLYFYGFSHSIQTAVLCLLIARRMNWPQPRVNSLMCAAISMNIPVLTLQGQMAKQDVPMRESQKNQIRRHPGEAHEWLQKAGVTDPEWLTAVLQHHERTDGSGYPQGLKEVAEIAVALRVADVFMAKISPRILRSALSIREAAKQLYEEDKGGPLSSAVIKEFGIYPPGEVVKLVSGETALVMRRAENPRCPKVACIIDAKGASITHTLHYDTALPEHAIAGKAPLPPNIARIPPERIYGYATVAPK